MHIRPLGFLGPKMKDFKKPGVEFKIKGDHEHLQGTTLSTVRLERRGWFRRQATLYVQVIDDVARRLLNTYGANATADIPVRAMKVYRAITGRIRYIDENGKKHKLKIIG